MSEEFKKVKPPWDQLCGMLGLQSNEGIPRVAGAAVYCIESLRDRVHKLETELVKIELRAKEARIRRVG